MNNIVSNFNQILDFGQSYGVPLTKKKGILREFLQSRIIDIIYHEKISLNLFFIGGTSLRLLRNLDRFSEDLDFDAIKLSALQIDSLVKLVYQKLSYENLKLDLYKNVTPKRTHYELRFKNLLYPLQISRNKNEKLMVKLDFERFWRGQKKDIVSLDKYAFTLNIVTLPLEQILVQKLYAYLYRKTTLARDIYDIIWLLSHKITVDKVFLKKNNISADILAKAKEKFLKEKKKLKNVKLKLRPFLFNETYLKKLDLFPQLIEKTKEIIC